MCESTGRTSKPQDVEKLCILQNTFFETESKNISIYPKPLRTKHRSLFQSLNWDGRQSWKNGGLFSAVVCLCIIAPFGALHLLAWDFDFPTAVEHSLWSVAGVGYVAFPIIAMIMGLSGNIHITTKLGLAGSGLQLPR